MVALTKNILLEKIRGAGALTDADLYKGMTKDGIVIPEDRFNKMLLDLEIMGLVKVAWVTKDGRRIEATAEEEPVYDPNADSSGRGENDNDGDDGSAATTGTDKGASAGDDNDMSYEASFPGLEK